MTSFVRSGTADLCIDDVGPTAAAGPPLVCLHAGVTDRRLWAPQREALGASHRVVAYDRRGFGETRLPLAGSREAFSQVGDLLRVLDALQLDRAVLIGCSQGGRIAIDAALAHPQRVRALVLVAAAVTGAPQIDLPYAPLTQARVEAYEAAEQRGDQTADHSILRSAASTVTLAVSMAMTTPASGMAPMAAQSTMSSPPPE